MGQLDLSRLSIAPKEIMPIPKPAPKPGINSARTDLYLHGVEHWSLISEDIKAQILDELHFRLLMFIRPLLEDGRKYHVQYLPVKAEKERWLSSESEVLTLSALVLLESPEDAGVGDGVDLPILVKAGAVHKRVFYTLKDGTMAGFEDKGLYWERVE